MPRKTKTVVATKAALSSIPTELVDPFLSPAVESAHVGVWDWNVGTGRLLHNGEAALQQLRAMLRGHDAVFDGAIRRCGRAAYPCGCRRAGRWSPAAGVCRSA
jgi:hypothetical protein